MGKKRQALSVLIVSTLAFTVCFMVWMMFGVIGIPIKKTLNLNSTQFGLLTAMPVLTGSLIRVPLGMWTDKFGGRIVMFVLMLVCVVPIWLIGYATEYWQFLVLGLFVGLAGVAAGEHDAGGEPLEVPLPRRDRRLVEVVQVEDEAPPPTEEED